MRAVTERRAYTILALIGECVVIRENQGRLMARDRINGIKGSWSFAKNWRTLYRGVPRTFFDLYLGEICLRFNHRGRDQSP